MILFVTLIAGHRPLLTRLRIVRFGVRQCSEASVKLYIGVSVFISWEIETALSYKIVRGVAFTPLQHGKAPRSPFHQALAVITFLHTTADSRSLNSISLTHHHTKKPIEGHFTGFYGRYAFA